MSKVEEFGTKPTEGEPAPGMGPEELESLLEKSDKTDDSGATGEHSPNKNLYARIAAKILTEFQESVELQRRHMGFTPGRARKSADMGPAFLGRLAMEAVVSLNKYLGVYSPMSEQGVITDLDVVAQAPLVAVMIEQYLRKAVQTGQLRLEQVETLDREVLRNGVEIRLVVEYPKQIQLIDKIFDTQFAHIFTKNTKPKRR